MYITCYQKNNSILYIAGGMRSVETSGLSSDSPLK